MSTAIVQAFSRLKEKKLKMIWEVSCGGNRSFLAGTAHFFPLSFRKSLSEYIEKVDTVLIEGPLDKDTMTKVREAGRQDETIQSLQVVLDHETKKKLVKALALPFRSRSTFFKYYGTIMEKDARDSLERTLNEVKPWLAFFRIWHNYLRVRGWAYSMDKEIYRIAMEMNKHVSYLEGIDEQIAALEQIPLENITRFLDRIENWREYTNKYVRIFRRGEIEKLMTLAQEFPTRCKAIVEDRDTVLYERMKPFAEQGNAFISVGITHILGIQRMLNRDGFTIKQLR